MVQPPEPDAARETAERTTSLLSRFLTARGMRREHQNLVAPPEDVMGLAQNNVNTSEAGAPRSRVPLDSDALYASLVQSRTYLARK